MRNENLKRELKMTELREKIRESRLIEKYYGQVKRMDKNKLVRWAVKRRLIR